MINYFTSELTVRSNNKGRGVYTIQDLTLNARVCRINGKRIQFKDTLELSDESVELQTGKNEYILPEYPFFLFNHSCDPNCGINSDLELITLRPVKKREELIWDYSTSMMERSWAMDCNCGVWYCRKWIRDFDTLPANQ